MLNIYYGRESVNKEKFIYDCIAKRGFGPGRRTFVIVPDQYTLESERQAFRYLGKNSLMGLEVCGFSRLGYNILAAEGGKPEAMIDKYGRQMLLARVCRGLDDKLEVFKGKIRKPYVLETVNDMISEMKQYGVTPESLENTFSELDSESLLVKKLKDILLVYAGYEDEIRGRYTDSEDLLDIYNEKIRGADMMTGASVWIYGFDSFAPKTLATLAAIMSAAADVNLVLTYDENAKERELFVLTELVMDRVLAIAAEENVEMGERTKIEGYDRSFGSAGIAELEKRLYDPAPEASEDFSGITLLEAANSYNEAEAAAAFVLHLVRDEGLRYRDIGVIVNDLGTLGAAAERVFDEYGLALFRDKKRKIANSNVAIFLVSLIETVAAGYRTQDLFKALKTGLSDLSREEIEDLENYSIKYGIKGSMWKKPFAYGAYEYGDDGLAELNAVRERALAPFLKVEEMVKNAGTCEEFLKGYYEYVADVLKLPEKLDILTTEQRDRGLMESSEETRQIWTVIVGLLDQIVALTGPEKFSCLEFLDMFRTGLSLVEVGVLPATADDINMGTMQRTRLGEIKALVVMGANEGVIPSEIKDGILFQRDEIETLHEAGQEIMKADGIMAREEKLAIYRNLARPDKYLWVSYSTGDEEGKERRPSEIVETIRRVFPALEVSRELEDEHPEDLIGTSRSTASHLAAAMRSKRGNEPVWAAAAEWYREEDPDVMRMLEQGLGFKNEAGPLSGGLSEVLFRETEDGRLVQSPSRIEKYAKCPFQYFVDYGLRPEELRKFETGSREVGDVLHSLMMDITERLSAENLWDEVTEEELRRMVEEALSNRAASYREGLFNKGKEENYRADRLKRTCFEALVRLVDHMRKGKVAESGYEVGFGKGRPLPPITVELDGKNVDIQGQIDRMDVLANDRVKIIDYKSGNLSLDEKAIRAGNKLQLMLYLAATGKEPGGVFYFQIKEPWSDGLIASGEGNPEEIAKTVAEHLKEEYRLKGIIADDPETVNDILGEFEGPSEVLPVKKEKGALKSLKTAGGIVVSDEEFKSLQSDVEGKVKELISDMDRGEIPIHPMYIKDGDTPCKYCGNKSICRFDTVFDGCAYNVIR